VFRAELDGILHHAVGRLPERDRRILGARYLRGMMNREIAAEFGMREGSVSTTVARALERLRPILQELLGEDRIG